MHDQLTKELRNMLREVLDTYAQTGRIPATVMACELHLDRIKDVAKRANDLIDKADIAFSEPPKMESFAEGMSDEELSDPEYVRSYVDGLYHLMMESVRFWKKRAQTLPSGAPALPEPDAFVREWDGDVSDVGQLLAVSTEAECDAETGWTKMYSEGTVNEYIKGLWPEGWIPAPIKAIPEMVTAGQLVFGEYDREEIGHMKIWYPAKCWSAMLAEARSKFAPEPRESPIKNEEFLIYVDSHPVDVGKHYAEVHKMKLPPTPTMHGFELTQAVGGNSTYQLMLDLNIGIQMRHIGSSESVPLERGMNFYHVPPATYHGR